MNYSNMRLAPKCLPICVSQAHLPILTRHAATPSMNEVTNEVKYYLFQLKDHWKRHCLSDTYHRELKSLDVLYHHQFEIFLNYDAKVDDLEATFAKDMADWHTLLQSEPTHNVQFQTHYHLRIAEMKRHKKKAMKKMIESRLKMISIIGWPFIECMFHLFRIFPEHIFAHHRNGDMTHVIQHALNWINIIGQPESNANEANYAEPRMAWNKSILESIVGTLENYIDIRLKSEPERFIVHGIDHFMNESCQKYFDAIYIFKQRKEVFTFLLVAKRYQRMNENSTQRRKVTNEVLFFLCNEMVQHVASYLFDRSVLNYPENTLWI